MGATVQQSSYQGNAVIDKSTQLGLTNAAETLASLRKDKDRVREQAALVSRGLQTLNISDPDNELGKYVGANYKVDSDGTQANSMAQDMEKNIGREDLTDGLHTDRQIVTNNEGLDMAKAENLAQEARSVGKQAQYEQSKMADFNRAGLLNAEEVKSIEASNEAAKQQAITDSKDAYTKIYDKTPAEAAAMGTAARETKMPGLSIGSAKGGRNITLSQSYDVGKGSVDGKGSALVTDTTLKAVNDPVKRSMWALQGLRDIYQGKVNPMSVGVGGNVNPIDDMIKLKADVLDQISKRYSVTNTKLETEFKATNEGNKLSYSAGNSAMQEAPHINITNNPNGSGKTDHAKDLIFNAFAFDKTGGITGNNPAGTTGTTIKGRTDSERNVILNAPAAGTAKNSSAFTGIASSTMAPVFALLKNATGKDKNGNSQAGSYAGMSTEQRKDFNKEMSTISKVLGKYNAKQVEYIKQQIIKGGIKLGAHTGGGFKMGGVNDGEDVDTTTDLIQYDANFELNGPQYKANLATSRNSNANQITK